MTDTFDWDGLWQGAYDAWCNAPPHLAFSQAAAAYLRTRIEAAFVPLHRYETVYAVAAEQGLASVQATARAEAAEARVKVLEEALRELQDYGCPACNGDCGSANPPVISCPMQRITRAIRGQS